VKQPSFATKVGSTADVRRGADVILVHEPETGATLRTKGRFYFLSEAPSGSDAARELARELADLVRDEYYYDLSAGVEVSLRKALRNANRRAAQRIKEIRGAPVLHCACAVLVNKDLYAARIGACQVFLVRHARLFMPGEEPGEMADFVHRTTTRHAASLGAEPDLLPAIWRQTIEPQDTVILASGALVGGLGADALLNAAVTLHPRAAAEHLHNRFVAEGFVGSDSALLIEVSATSGAASRVVSAPVRVSTPAEVAAAESIRSRLDWIWRRRPKIGTAAKAVATPAATAVTKGVAIGLELMPKKGAPLPRGPDTARQRLARQRRVTTILAAVLLAVTFSIAGLVLRDYQANQVVADYRLVIQRIEEDIASARRLLTQQRPDPERARERLAAAMTRIGEARNSSAAEEVRLAGFRDEIAGLLDRLANVSVDLARIAPGAGPVQLAASANGLYAADPGAGRLWRIFGEPVETGIVLQKGQRNVGAPVAVATLDDVVYTIDDQRRVWKAQGNTIVDVTPPDTDRWKSVSGLAMFVGNLYVLDAQSGQLWKHEPDATGRFGPAVPFIAAPLPPNTARSVAVDGDVWIVTSAGEVLRLRRQGLETAAGRIDFTARWDGEAVKPIAIQALESQRSVYFLDQAGKRVVRMTRDGRETARFALSVDLDDPTAFYVSEDQQVAYTIHGSKLAVTDISR